MTTTPSDAERALAEVRTRRQQVVTGPLLPGWYWSALGALMLVFVGAVESKIPWVVGVGVAVFAVGLVTLVLAVVRQTPVQVHRSLLGARGVLTIVGYALALSAVGVGIGVGLQTAGVQRPATIGVGAVAVLLVVTGPLLVRRLRRLMSRRPLRGAR
jgi:hypothetical protein